VIDHLAAWKPIREIIMQTCNEVPPPLEAPAQAKQSESAIVREAREA